MPIFTDRGRRGGGIPIDPTVPDAPVLDGTAGNTVVHLSWMVPADNGATITGYRVYRDGVLVATPAGTSFDDTGRTNGVTYAYRVTALNTAGESQMSNVVQVAPAPEPPAAPELDGTAGNGSVSLSWTAPANHGATITSYRIYRSGALLTTVSGSTTTLLDSTVSNGTTYAYTVTAVNSAGEGDESNEISATPTASTAPSLPPDAIVGAPAYRALWWGGGFLINAFQSNFDLWKTAGFIGMNASAAEPTANVATTIAGTGQQLFDTSVLNLPDTAGSNHQWQRGWEGAAAAGITGAHAGPFWYRHNIDASYEAYLGQYVARSGGRAFWPPFGALPLSGGNPTQAPDAREGSWWNDTYWATAAAWYAKAGRALKDVYFGSGLAFDPEPGNWTAGSPTHTADEHWQKTHDRAYQCGTAYWQAFPDGKLFVYQWSPSGSWGDWLRGWYYDGNTAPSPAMNEYAWMLGWVKAMCDFGSAQSRFTLMDRDFYQWGEGGMGTGADPRAAKLKLNNEGSFAQLTQDFPYGVGLDSFARGCDRIVLAPCSWPGNAAGSEKPNATSPSTWQTQCLVDREWAMAPFRVVYAAGTGAAGGISGTPGGLFYAQYGNTASTVYGMMTTHLAGNQAAMDQTPISTLAPTCTNLAWTGSTLTCRAAHKYGVKSVKVYDGAGFDLDDPEASYLGACRMTWKHPSLPDYVGTPGQSGGNGSASYPTLARVADSYQDCSFPTSGASGAWRVVKVTSVKDDVAWFRVQHP